MVIVFQALEKQKQLLARWRWRVPIPQLPSPQDLPRTRSWSYTTRALVSNTSPYAVHVSVCPGWRELRVRLFRLLLEAISKAVDSRESVRPCHLGFPCEVQTSINDPIAYERQRTQYFLAVYPATQPPSHPGSRWSWMDGLANGRIHPSADDVQCGELIDPLFRIAPGSRTRSTSSCQRPGVRWTRYETCSFKLAMHSTKAVVTGACDRTSQC